jgi:membrane-associated phospholipid phosphatase
MNFWLTCLPGYLGTIFHGGTAVAVLAVLVLLIGFSRIYLGAHYLSDVIAGYAAAAVWLTFCILVTDRTQRR